MPESGGCTWINKCRTSTWHKVDKRSHCGKKKAGLSMKLCWMWRRKAGVGGDGEEETTLCVMWGGRWRRCWSEHPRRVVRTGVSTALGPALFQQRLRVCAKPRLYFYYCWWQVPLIHPVVVQHPDLMQLGSAAAVGHEFHEARRPLTLNPAGLGTTSSGTACGFI